MTTILDAKTIPTGLRRNDAALHCGISPGFFDKLVTEGVLPPPRCLGTKVKIWMRQELDHALMSLPTEHPTDLLDNPCDILLE